MLQLFKTFFTSTLFLKVIFVVSLFVLVFITSIAYKYTLALKDSTSQLVHSYKIRVELEQLFTYLKDAETGQRGFIITRDSVYLEPFTGAREKVTKSLNSLKILTAQNEQQQDNLDSLYQLISLRFSILSHSLRMSSEIPLNKERLNRSMFFGHTVMNLIRTHINFINGLEMNYLGEHQKKYERELFITPFYTLLILLFSLMVFTFSYFKINKDYKILKTSNDQLLITTESIKHAEEIGDFSSWQWHLESNELIYSDNQFRLLGWEPQSFESSIENFLNFVHPDDRHLLTELVLNEKKASSVYFRVIRKDGELRYFKSIGKLLSDIKGKKIIIGVNSDVTEQHLNSLSLEERNRELEQSNKELASFNHVASHDLQEPLRIIQTYLSRITDKEKSTFSRASQEHFTRIQSSLDRMRILINDLLQYSRANKDEKRFVLTDLNLLMENAIVELAQAIEDKNAQIETSNLPILQVIPFQIQQLFVNLIGNSIKYSKSGRIPLIKIRCEKIATSDYSILKSDKYKSFYKITVSDNGLGFDQNSADKIFTLFHRLHLKTEYPGSGIGLSICKKIVENHGGIITAEGQLEIGALFHIFLPA